MPATKWKESICFDAEAPQPLSLAIMRCAALAGVHDVSFQYDINEGFATLDDWTTDGLATWSVASGQLSATGGGSAIMYEAVHDTEIPPSFVAGFDLVSGYGAFLFHCKDGASDCFGWYWDATYMGFVKVNASKGITSLMRLPQAISPPHRVTIAVKITRDTSDEDKNWMCMSMFADGMQKCCHVHDLGASDWDGDGIGFGCFNSNTFVVDNLQVQEFHRIAEYVSIDPGESPLSGMQRVMGGTRFRMYESPDGELIVRRPLNKSVDWAITDRVTSFAERREKLSTLTHVRIAGVYGTVDRLEEDEGVVHGHRFASIDNAWIESDDQLWEEAGHALADAKEQQEGAQLLMPLQALIEPWDLVSYDGTTYRVLRIQHNLDRAGRGSVKASTAIEARKYLER